MRSVPEAFVDFINKMSNKAMILLKNRIIAFYLHLCLRKNLNLHIFSLFGKSIEIENMLMCRNVHRNEE